MLLLICFFNFPWRHILWALSQIPAISVRRELSVPLVQGKWGGGDAAPLPRPSFHCPQHLPFPTVSIRCAAEASAPGSGLCWAGGYEPAEKGRSQGGGWHHSAKWNPAEKLVTPPSGRSTVLFISVVLECLSSIFRKEKSPSCAILPYVLLYTALS